MVPDLSVVIPVFNRRKSIVAALESIVAARGGFTLEVIVSDNSSEDGTVEAVRSWCRSNTDVETRLITSTWNEGPVPNWLRGIRAARAPVCKILWSDDYLLPGALERMHGLLTSDERIRVVTCGAKVIGPKGTPVKTLYEDWKGRFTLSDLLAWRTRGFPQVPLSPSASLLYRADALEALELSQANTESYSFAVGPDLLMLCSGIAHGGFGVHVNEPLVAFGADIYANEEKSITLATGPLWRRRLYDLALLGALESWRKPDLALRCEELRVRVWEAQLWLGVIQMPKGLTLSARTLFRLAAWWLAQSSWCRKLLTRRFSSRRRSE